MISNWITNSEMKKLLKEVSEHPCVESLKFNFSELHDLFFPKFKKVKDCVIIAEESVDELEMTFDRVMKTYFDKTEYEVSNTDTRIDCYFEDKVSVVTRIQVALITLEIWTLKLKQMETYSKFCLIMYGNEDRVEIRFHKVRDNEISWLSDNLEGYKGDAVGYVIV